MSAKNEPNKPDESNANEVDVPRLVRWWVCDLDRYGMPNWKNADGPHSDRKSCEETVAIMKRLTCIEDKERVICEVRIYDGKESSEGINHDAIDTLNSISANVQGEAQPPAKNL